VTRRGIRSIRTILAFVVALAAGFSGRARAEETTLLAPDGTVYDVQAGLASDLGIAGGGVSATEYVIEWTSYSQTGERSMGLVPNTTSANPKRNLDLAYDDQSGSLILLWKEDLGVLNVLHLGVLQSGTWKQLDLLPNIGFAHAYNPQMLLSKQTVHWIDANGNDAWRTRSLLSVIWWEESQFAQARYAPIFLDEDTTADDVVVYDLPKLVGPGGATSYGSVPPGAYMYPSLKLEGPGGAILASFADLSSNHEYVARITYPTDLGRADASSKSWLRRHIPVVGVAFTSGLPGFAPRIPQTKVTTIIGPAYNPTLVWTDNAVRYTHFDTTSGAWSEARAIVLSDDMTKDRALALVQEMATRN
jgi:hypothetical protein